MHFVTGGAYNGKRKWVKEHMVKDAPARWISGYEKTVTDLQNIEAYEKLTVIEGLEQFIYAWLENHDWRREWHTLLHQWMKWETENRKLIIIGTDMSKGIVPMDAKERLWRDVTGWCYQDIVNHASTVDVVWYGVSERLKGEIR